MGSTKLCVFTAFFEFVCVLIVFLLVCVSSPASSTVALGLTFGIGAEVRGTSLSPWLHHGDPEGVHR